MSEAPTTEEAPERMFANEGVHMQGGVVTLVRIPTMPFSSLAEEAFGPEWIRADIADAQVEALTKERDLLADPNAVHVNMLSGRIAKPSVAQIEHIYPEISALRALLREAGDALRAISEGVEISDPHNPGCTIVADVADPGAVARAVLAKIEALK